MEFADISHYRPAAQYLRMSTDRQDVSLEYQTKSIAKWAEAHGYRIVATYVDEGVSGVGIERRQALKDLLRTVIGGQSDFLAVLVYDVSRWGRFQNPDQAAHYEFMCQEAGVPVEYCAESFRNDGSAMSGLIKHVKRTMAAEFSREASARLSNTKMVLRNRCYWTGGLPGYGYRRAVVNADGAVLRVCYNGEKASTSHCHTRLVFGPTHEVETARRIFREFLRPESTYTSVMKTLNAEGVTAELGARWSLARVRQVLTNPKYCGRLVQGKHRHRLGGVREPVDSRFWVVSPEACPPIVSTELFDDVSAKLEANRTRPTRAEMIAELQRVALEQGKLSDRVIIEHCKYGRGAIMWAFGGLKAAYEAAGYVQTPLQKMYAARIEAAPKKVPVSKYETTDLLDMLRAVWKQHGRITTDLIDATPGIPGPSTFTRRFGTIADAYIAIGYEPNAQQTLMAERVRGSGTTTPKKKARGLRVLVE